MTIVAQAGDPRIVEINELAAEENLPLALSAETIVALEDAGFMADPFTGLLWPDPAACVVVWPTVAAAAIVFQEM